MKNKIKIVVEQEADIHMYQVNKDFAGVLRQYTDYQKVKRNYHLGGLGLGLLSVGIIVFSLISGEKGNPQPSPVARQQQLVSAIDMGPYPQQTLKFPNIAATHETDKDEVPQLVEMETKEEVVTTTNVEAKPKEDTYSHQDLAPSIPPNSPAEPVKGFQNLYEYFFTNLNYPAEAVADSIEGVVKVAFIVNTDSTISNLKVLQSLGPALDKEAFRLIENMPRWKPAVENGVTISSTFIMPVRFNIEDDE